MSRKAPPHGGNRRLAAERYGLPADAFCDFSSNTNPLGPPPGVLEALRRGLDEIERYPDPDAVGLRRALAGRLGVPFASTRALNGAAAGFFLMLRLWRPRRVLLVMPSFSEYERAARSVGAEVCTVRLRPDRERRRFELDPDAVSARLGPETVLILANPNNPTGHALEPPRLRRLLAAVREANSRLLVDEAFLDFLSDGDARSLRSPASGSGHGDLVVIGSLTKLFAIAGLRLGYIVAPPELLIRLDALRDPWSVNHLAQLAGECALAPRRDWERFVRSTRAFVARERSWLVAALERLPRIYVWRSEANFLLLEFLPPWPPSKILADVLGRRGILIRDASNFPGLTTRHVRIAVRPREENARLVDALRAIATDFNLACDLRRSRDCGS